MTLTFNERNHSYKLDGRPVPGVTTLIGKGIPKPALTYWSAKMVAEFVADNQADIEGMWAKGRGPMVAYLKAVPWQKRDDAAVRGTDVHAIAERVVHGEEVDVPDHLREYVEGYIAWLDAHDVKPILTERSIGNRQWKYAGRFDLIAKVDGVDCLLDVKTASGIYGETALQLAAYANAEFWTDDDGTEHPMPAVARQGALHVQPGLTEAHWSTDPDAAWNTFLHAAYVARRTDDLKTYMRLEQDTA